MPTTWRRVMPWRSTWWPPAFVAMVPPMVAVARAAKSTPYRQPAARAAASTASTVAPAPAVSWPTAASTSPTAFSRAVESTTCPASGTAPPTRPVLPPCGTTGVSAAAHAATTAATSAVSAGRTTARHSPRHRPVQSVTCAAVRSPVRTWRDPTMARSSSTSTARRSVGVGEVRGSLLEVRADRLDVVRRADQRGHRLGLRGEPLGERHLAGHGDQPLRALDGLRALRGDLTREFERGRPGIVGEVGGEAELDAFAALDHATGERQLLGDVETDEPGQHLGAGHVGDEPPADLENAHRRVGGDEADVGGERDLEAGAERGSVDRGDDGSRLLGPGVGGLLPEGGDAVAPVEHPPGRDPVRVARALGPTGHRLEAREVEPCAEPAPLAREHDGPHRTVGLQLLARLDECLEHRAVDRVELVGTVEADIGDTALDGD